MKRLAFAALVACAVVGVLGGSAAYAQSIGIVKVPFAFVIDNKDVPAGSYEFTVSGTEDSLITVTPMPKGSAMVMPVITRLAQQGVNQDMRIVFDEVGGKYHVSEVWYPAEDGFLVKDTKVKHTHRIVTVEKKKKT